MNTTEYIRYSQVKVGDSVKLPEDDAHGLRAWRNRQTAEKDPAPFRTVTKIKSTGRLSYIYIITDDGLCFTKPSTSKALIQVQA